MCAYMLHALSLSRSLYIYLKVLIGLSPCEHLRKNKAGDIKVGKKQSKTSVQTLFAVLHFGSLVLTLIISLCLSNFQ